MSVFAGIGDIKLYDRNPYFTKGLYTLEILQAEVLKTRNKGDAFIVTFKVLSSSNASEHPAGSKRTWYQGLSDPEIAQKTIKSFMMALLGLTPKSPAAELKEFNDSLEATLNAGVTSNALAGLKVALEVVPQTTKDGLREWSKHNFAPISTATAS